MALLLLLTAGAASAALQKGFFVVHCEPLIHNDPLTIGGAMNLRRPAMYWNALSELVSLAQSNGHCVTIMFNPQWALYAAQLPARRLQLVEWTAAGHELALHHHGEEAREYGNDWDGFSNSEILAMDTNCFGDIPFMMTQGIYTNYTILSATTEDGDWPEGVLYYPTGGGEAYSNALHPGDLVSTACPTSMAGKVGGSLQHNGVWTYRMRLFTDTVPQVNALLETQSALVDCAGLDGTEYVLGYVTHAKNYYDTRTEGRYQELFSTLTNAGVQLVAVSNVASMMSLGTPVPPPSTWVESAPPHVEVSWDTTNDGLTYQLQHTTNLVDSPWADTLPAMIGDGSNHCETIAVETNTLRYFRVTATN